MLHAAGADVPAWQRDALSPADWLIPLPSACVAELDAVVRFLRKFPRPVWHLAPEAFELRACTHVMAQVREQLHYWTGFVVVDRIPVERYSATENRAIVWLLGSLMGQLVAQKWNGTVLYDVKDTRKPVGFGAGRRAIIDLAQDFHTDGGWLELPPAAVGLFCLQPAQQGGLSRLVSLVTAHNELQRWHPELLERLYRPFCWDRQGEHAPGDSRMSWQPVFQYVGHTLMARFCADAIFKGYRLAGIELDDAGAAALAALRAILYDPAHRVEFRLEKGQLQYVNNRQCAHARTAFVDDPGALEQRHMLRLWNRDEGTPDLDGQADDTPLDL
jgi:alpha-ketoglutarate-dependent taurine dioxygenase